MITSHIFSADTCPYRMQNKIIKLLKDTWPQSFTNNQKNWPLESNLLRPISIVIVKNNVLLSHVLVLRTTGTINNNKYFIFGISSMVTKNSYRKKGFGRRALLLATEYMKEEKADIGIFTCDRKLIQFYTCNGWFVSESSPIIGGTKEKPFNSKDLGKVTFINLFSKRAIIEKNTILKESIFIELGEGKLW